MIASILSAALIGLLAAQQATEPSLSSSSSINLVEIVTAAALVVATILSFCFWYVANKPNIIVRPKFQSGSTTIVITNEGRTPAKNLRIKSKSLSLRRDSKETLDICLPAMYPKEELEYYVAPGHQAVNYEPYEFDVIHRRWLWKWAREKRNFTIDFRQYEHVLADHHVTTPFERTMDEIARIGNTLIQMHVNKKDRFRLWKETAKYRARTLRRRVAALLRRTNRSDG